MNLDYCELIKEVMKPKAIIEVHPTLTYGPMGWEFNGFWYGSNRYAAEAARDEYYSSDDIKNVL